VKGRKSRKGKNWINLDPAERLNFRFQNCIVFNDDVEKIILRAIWAFSIAFTDIIAVASTSGFNSDFSHKIIAPN